MCGKFRISHQCAIRFDSLGRNAFLLDVSLKAIFVMRAGSQGLPFFQKNRHGQEACFAGNASRWAAYCLIAIESERLAEPFGSPSIGKEKQHEISAHFREHQKHQYPQCAG